METDRPTDGPTDRPTDRPTRQSESSIAPPTFCGGGINIALSVSNNDIYMRKTEHVCLLSGVAIGITETWYLTVCLTIQQTI